MANKTQKGGPSRGRPQFALRRVGSQLPRAPRRKEKRMDGITVKEYLEKARTMFQDMDLQWDLDELDKITTAF